MATTQDRRRFNAPEGSESLSYAVPSTSKLPLLDSAQSRADGRRADQVRSIFLKTGLITQADGSAYIETGRTKLVVAVYGPKPTPPSVAFNPKARLNVEITFAPFASGVRRFAPGKDTEAPALAATLYQALLPSLILDALPKSQIDLFVTILESDGSDADISAGVTAASVALAEAGVQMYGLVTGTYAAFVPIPDSSPVLVLDPTRDEARQASAFASLACMPALGTVTNVGMSGVVSLDEYEQALKLLISSCAQIHAVSKQALVESAESREAGP